MNPIRSHKDLIVWQGGVELAIAVYELTERFPRSLETSLSKNMRCVAIAIPARIAEGHSGGQPKSMLEGLRAARRACAELEVYIALAKMLPGTNQILYTEVDEHLSDETKMLNALSFSLRRKQKSR